MKNNPGEASWLFTKILEPRISIDKGTGISVNPISITTSIFHTGTVWINGHIAESVNKSLARPTPYPTPRAVEAV